MNKGITALIALILGAGLGYFGYKYMQETSTSYVAGCISSKEYGLRTGLNKLWSDHVIYTRLYIISAIAGLKDADATLNRLMKNQEDLGNAIIPFYGQEAGNKLTQLLKAHIAIAGELVKAAIAKDDAQVKAIDEKWHKNADQMAELLSSANPHWTYDALKNMLYEHLKITLNEAVLRLGQKWDEDITNFDKIFAQALMMAKDLSDGIVKQFPNKF
ncbi:MAG TPA: hypothetical protein VFF04_01985 [Candidatus Babeliales bacterium]|nr:hypothetical protein [Candidatus Babeliales bacterium]